MHRFYESLSKFLKEHPTLAIATVIETKGSAPRETAAKMIVFPNGGTHGTIGGGRLERMVTEDAVKALKNGKSITKKYTLKERKKGGIGQICGGSSSVFIEIVKSPDTILMCGGGHISKAMAPMVTSLGMNLIIVDERQEFATHERFPGATKVLQTSPSDPGLKDLVTSSTSIVIFTHSHKQDKEALRNLVSTDAAYIGMIGSEKKVKTIFKELKAVGIPAKALNRVYSPIGLDIGAETPAEIALSILSEIVHVMRKGSPSPSSMRMTSLRGVKKK